MISVYFNKHLALLKIFSIFYSDVLTSINFIGAV